MTLGIGMQISIRTVLVQKKKKTYSPRASTVTGTFKRTIFK